MPGPTQVTLNRILCAEGMVLDDLIDALNAGSELDCDPDAAMSSCACFTGSETDLALSNMQKLCTLSSLIAQINVHVNDIVSGVSGLLYGHGSPEGVKVGKRGWHYCDLDTGADYVYVNPIDSLTVGWV